MVTKFQEFLRNFRIPEKFCGILWGKIPGNFFRISQNCDATKIYHLRDQFWGIFWEFPRNQESLPKKSPRLENLGKLLTFVTWELIKSVHLTYWSCAYDLQKVCIQPKIDGTIWPTKSVHMTYKKSIRPTKSVHRT